jgi:hypothetical protein
MTPPTPPTPLPIYAIAHSRLRHQDVELTSTADQYFIKRLCPSSSFVWLVCS